MARNFEVGNYTELCYSGLQKIKFSQLHYFRFLSVELQGPRLLKCHAQGSHQRWTFKVNSSHNNEIFMSHLIALSVAYPLDFTKLKTKLFLVLKKSGRMI